MWSGVKSESSTVSMRSKLTGASPPPFTEAVTPDPHPLWATSANCARFFHVIEPPQLTALIATVQSGSQHFSAEWISTI